MFKRSISGLFILSLVIPSMAFAKKAIRPIDFVPGEIIIKYKEGKAKKLSAVKGALSARPLVTNTFLVKTNNKNNLSLKQMIKDLNEDPNIIYAEPNYIYKASKLESPKTSDPLFGKLWGLVNTGSNEPTKDGDNSSPSGVRGSDINALNAWKITKGNKRIKIAVIDTGVDYNHQDLIGNIWTNTAEKNGLAGVDDDGNGYIDDIHGYDFAGKDGDPMDGNGHGTHCAGTIAATHGNSIGVAGVMAHAQIVAVKFLSDDGSGTSADALSAVDYATKVGVDIMNNSWGGGGRSQALEDAIKRARDAGIVFTAAAGNSATNNDSVEQFPANYDVENVISVAAHNYNDGLASFSCYGKNTVHVSAPGRNILSTMPNNNYTVLSGTSMATPHVTGVIGLYLSKYGKQNLKGLRDQLMRTSVYSKSLGRKTASRGRVDAYNFLKNISVAKPALPSESAWKNQTVKFFESPHPYLPNSTISRTYNVPGVKFLRVIIRKHAMERDYDYLSIVDKNGDVIERVSGVGADYKTDYVEGDSITVRFESDRSIEDFGFEIDEIQYIK